MKPAVSDPPEVEQQLWQGFHGDVGWDIGANCGQSIPIMLNRFQTVLAFEPAVECFPYLTLTTHTYADASFFPIALSNIDATTDLVALPSKIDTGQLVSTDAAGMEYDPKGPDAVVRSVDCRKVDTLVDSGDFSVPDFLKIDVEGHEFKVLAGAIKTLAITRPDILLEFHSAKLHTQCAGLLEGLGYTVETVRHPHYPAYSDLWHAHGWIRATCS